MPNDHIVTSYDKELENLRSSIARMGGVRVVSVPGNRVLWEWPRRNAAPRPKTRTSS